MIKVSTFLADSPTGYAAVPLFGPADSYFEKTASSGLLPEVLRYIDTLTPRNGSQYVLVNAMGAGEFFGCFPAGTLVETSTGEKPIEKIEPGEQVRTHKNRFRSVVARAPKRTEELCDLYVQGLPSNLPVLTATPNHELWVVTRDEFLKTKRRVVWKRDTSSSLDQRREQALKEMEFSWVPISELRAGDMVAEPFPLDEDSKALGDEKWNCSEVAFLMGLYAAEGCTVSRAERPGDDHYVVFVISHLEGFTLQHARDGAAKFGYKLYEDEAPETHSIRLELHWQEFARLCREHVGKLAHSKRLSPALLRMPRGWQRVFWAAYRAGDGCVRGEGKEEGTVRVASASAALLRGVRLLLARSGLVASISGRHNKKATWYTGKPIYELALSGGQLRGRGTPKSYLHPGGFILSSVKKVEQYDWSGEVYDLTVEEDSSFVASGVAVHNSNINGDHFPEAGLIHSPDSWTGNPLIDKRLAKTWPYGFPTFYGAHPYAHHKNKDPSRAYGEVELATWNDHMKRVELVCRVDYDKCCAHGGVPVWDKLKGGQFPDVSMGSKVPYDTCSICLDWKRYKDALATFDPKKHRHPGIAVLAVHKKNPIRGVSITRKDYCKHTSKYMNRILPDGRKVFVYNDFPRFFDISFVFIGADKTAKVMVFIKRAGQEFAMPSVLTAERMGIDDSDIPEGSEKTASVSDRVLERAFLKVSGEKMGEIDKEVVPSQFAGKAIPILTKREPDLPEKMMKLLAAVPLRQALSTTTGLGMLLRPREFSKVVSLRSQRAEPEEDVLDTDMSVDDFLPALARLLLPMMSMRSALGPFIEKRVIILCSSPPSEVPGATSLSPDELRKMGAAYTDYRQGVMNLVPNTQDFIESAAGSSDHELHKLAEAEAGEIFTPLAFRYLNDAFMDEPPFGGLEGGVVKTSSQAFAGVERGLPSRNTWKQRFPN